MDSSEVLSGIFRNTVSTVSMGEESRVEFEPSSNVYYVYGSHHTTGINLKAGEIYGTKRCNGYKVLENLLNSRSSRVYDTIKDADGKNAKHP